MKGKGRLLMIFAVIAAFVIFFSQCVDAPKELKATENTLAGSESCKQCHQKIYNDYQHDFHARTSRAVRDTDLVEGPLPDSIYRFHKHLKIQVEKRSGGMYQVAYFDGEEAMARRFDVVIGSGKHAYTYGSWQGKMLLQLPLSYFRAINAWANSPGFPKDRVHFSRPIDQRCLECHSSFVEQAPATHQGIATVERFQPGSVVYGINCERCHGPAGRHVEFHRNDREEKKPHYITLYSSLTRKQRLDACGICHSGVDMQSLKTTFNFKPGDTLESYYAIAANQQGQASPDVHGNQVQMLAQSKCFTASDKLDCNTCHSPHESKKAGLTAYSRKCMSCHPSVEHSAKTLSNAMVKTNCIDCHMPLQKSRVISFQEAGKSDASPYKLHTHRIAIY
ncbi:cytochrome c3 family protein [Pedobacter deserti]|uniref:cytochrome c3 family protein n=1 Tax=Pedobacter deserti TaxID=2817382 RepID=UPI0021095100|nr:multiheme c-type cytochrome [Pedobacter sp. SYSU D00382]